MMGEYASGPNAKIPSGSIILGFDRATYEKSKERKLKRKNFWKKYKETHPGTSK